MSLSGSTDSWIASIGYVYLDSVRILTGLNYVSNVAESQAKNLMQHQV